MNLYFYKQALGAAVAILVCGSIAYADVLSPDDALRRALDHDGAPAKARAFSLSSPKLVFTQLDSKDTPAVYLFNDKTDGNGYLLLSADDMAPAILGFGDITQSDDSDFNPEFKWWIEEYGRQIEWMRKNPGSVEGARKAPGAPYFSEIAPKVTTKWNQSEPFNNLCPVYQGQRCVTGCVATALSQLMKYHNWPPTGAGSNSYTPRYIGRELSMNFGATSFDWQNMLDVYDGSASDVQKNAVANLLYAVGVGVDMEYSPSASSASDSKAAFALTNYFRYQPGIIVYDRDCYPLAEWDEFVYNQIKEYGPVYYSGASNSSGHAFICDGYREGYFHINWGWGGMSDGYFILSALDPDSQGIGGSTSGYNFQQNILGHVKPDDGSSEQQPLFPYMTGAKFVAESSSVSLGDVVRFEGGCFNGSSWTVNVKIAVKAVDADGNVTYMSYYSASDLEPNWGYSSITARIPSDLAEGSYSISPVVQDENGVWYDVFLQVGCERTTTMVVKDGVASFVTVGEAAYKATNLTALTPFYFPAQFMISFDIENGDNDFIGRVRAAFAKADGTFVAYGAESPLYLAANETKSFSDYMSSWYTPNGASVSPGTYYLCLIDNNGKVVSDKIEVEIKQNVTPTIGLNKFDLIGDSTKVPKDRIQFEVELECVSGYFANTLRVLLFPYIPGQSVYSEAEINSLPIILEGGQSKNFVITGSYENGVVGKQYFANLYSGSTKLSNYQPIFTLADPVSGIDDVVSDFDATVTVDYFSINGSKVAKENLVPGLYIVRKVSADGAISTSKVFIK